MGRNSEQSGWEGVRQLPFALAAASGVSGYFATIFLVLVIVILLVLDLDDYESRARLRRLRRHAAV